MRVDVEGKDCTKAAMVDCYEIGSVVVWAMSYHVYKAMMKGVVEKIRRF